MVTKRIKSSIRAERAHGPTRSVQPQPPPNGHLVTHSTPGVSPIQGKGLPIAKRKHEELPLTGGKLCWQVRKTPTRCGTVVLGSFLTRPSGEYI